MTAPAHLSGGRSGSTDVVDRPSQGNLPMSVTDLPEAVQAQSRGRAATGSNQSSDPDRVIHTRRVSFEESLADLPKFFAANGNPVSSHFAASLSSLFPDGEDYFVRSVRHFRDRITDPDLKRQVAGFIGQESVHGREHRYFNQRLDELGYNTRFSERMTKRSLEARTRFAPAKANLAATAALEHFTATLAELLLADEDARNMFGHDGARHLFVWHALEESEHKAVAFDVYRAVGGSERMRVWTMKFIRSGLAISLAFMVIIGIVLDRDARRQGSLRRHLKEFGRSPVVSKETWRRLCEYDRPGFHPNDRDTTALEEEWRNRFFGTEGELNGNLLKASA